MKNPLKPITFLVCCYLFLSCQEKEPKDVAINRAVLIIPEPAETIHRDGTFEFNQDTRFVAQNEQQKLVSQLLVDKLGTAAGFSPEIAEKAPTSNYIVFNTDESLEAEAYTLVISSDAIAITSNGFSGTLYAIETLRQLLSPEIKSAQQQKETTWSVPNLEIKDYPRYPWRGLMLDVARHFFGKDYVLKTIDRMAMFKLNTLHLHLVDDQGWRIEIKKYPKLTEVGGFRVDQEDKHWDARSKNRPNDKATYGGFYTQEDIREIVAHAQDRGITVVPEIEMPAHVSSALAAYPEFSCFNEQIAVPSGGLWPITDIYCPGKEKTFGFLEDVLSEVMELFPSKYIHVGGDEATRTNWEKCPHCQKRMRDEGLENTAELQSYFIKRMERFVSSNDRRLLGWDEILEGGIAPGATVMSWRGIEGGWEASKEGHDVVMTPNVVYFNQYQGEPDYEPIAFGGYVPLNQVYAFDPVVDSMSTAQQKHILGSQANLWSEFITNEKESEYMLYPRLAALSEALWTPKDKKDWQGFAKKVPALFERFDAMGINYSRSAYAVTAQSELNDDGSITVRLQNEFPDSEILFALNDNPLTTSSQAFKDSLRFDVTTTIKTAFFEDGQIVGDTLTKTFNFHKGVGKPITYTPEYSKQYSGTGNNTMVNVLRGSKNFHDGQWLAWLEDDAEMIMDLEPPTEISSVAVGAMENQGSGIYYPTKIEVAVSEDGKSFNKVGEMDRSFQNNGYVGLEDFKVEFEAQNARFIKINVTNLAHPPTGGSAFMFLDEIILE